jgi:hypothetical protein
VWTEDWKADPSLHYRPETVAALEGADAPRANIAVPIVIRDEVYGVLLGGVRRTRHRFTEHDVHVLSSMAAQAAVAIENARLYTVTQYNLAAAALLNDAARTLHRTLDARRLLPDALQGLGQTFSAEGAAVILFGGRQHRPAGHRHAGKGRKIRTFDEVTNPRRAGAARKLGNAGASAR